MKTVVVPGFVACSRFQLKTVICLRVPADSGWAAWATPCINPEQGLPSGTYELLRRRLRGSNELAQRALGDFVMIGHGRGDVVVVLDKDNGTTALARDFPAQRLKDFNDRAAAEREQAR